MLNRHMTNDRTDSLSSRDDLSRVHTKQDVGLRALLFTLMCFHLMQYNAAGGLAEQLSLKSDFIFKGTVRKANASTMRAVPASESTAIVRVDEVVQAKSPDDSFGGKEITVLLSKPGSVKVGQQAIFFTIDYLAGDSIAVRSLGEVTTRTNSPVSIQSQVKSLAQDHALDPLRKRIQNSVAIIEGKVIETKPLGEEQDNKPRSEREPEWWTATIEVQAVDKGNIPDKKLLIRFPHNNAIPGAPKFAEGQQGIFLLHHEKARMLPIELLVALDTLDFQPSSNSSLIKETVQLQSIVTSSTPAPTPVASP